MCYPHIIAWLTCYLDATVFRQECPASVLGREVRDSGCRVGGLKTSNLQTLSNPRIHFISMFLSIFFSISISFHYGGTGLRIEAPDCLRGQRCQESREEARVNARYQSVPFSRIGYLLGVVANPVRALVVEVRADSLAKLQPHEAFHNGQHLSKSAASTGLERRRPIGALPENPISEAFGKLWRKKCCLFSSLNLSSFLCYCLAVKLWTKQRVNRLREVTSLNRHPWFRSMNIL